VTVASAPGKLFVSGEWAVLEGAPAIVAAVDRTARVELALEPSPRPLVIESIAEGRTWSGDAAHGTIPSGDAGAVVAALRATGAAGGRAVVDTRAFLVGERKLGLGRSAATIAAAVVARLAHDGAPAPARVLAAALDANARFQDGVGSGADVAAAVHGGVIDVRRDGAGLAVSRRALPRGLHLIAGWTGEAAPTAPLVRRFAARPMPPVMRDLAGAAVAAAEAVAAGDAARLCEAVDRAGDLLRRLGEEADLPIVTPALARLVAAARRAGAAAKPSGAGAGDCGIALATSPAIAGAVRAAWRDAGILPLDVTIAAEGAAVA
jgi:phosphomevalonate kinase